MKKRTSWNKGLSADPNNPNYDPRVAKYVENGRESKRGKSTWIKGRTKETEPILAEFGRRHSEYRKKNFWSSWNKGLSADPNSPNYDPRVEKNVRSSGETIGKQLRTGKRDVWNKGLSKEDHPSIMSASKKLRVIGTNRKGRFPRTDTSIEILLQESLRLMGIEFETDKPLMGVTRVDVFLKPNICIYADGDYWHSLPDVKKRDKRQTRTLQENGFIVLRFSETMINENIKEVVSQIRDTMLQLGGIQDHSAKLGTICSVGRSSYAYQKCHDDQ